MSHSACNDPRCAELIEGRVATCPKCGGSMRSVGESPGRGILLLLCGLFLLGLMGSITWYMLPMLLRPGVETADGSTFTGTPEQARMALGLFGLVLLFGLVATANGIFMIVTRRQSWAFIGLTLGLAALLLIVGFVFMGTAG
jgi:hypothetical protein